MMNKPPIHGLYAILDTAVVAKENVLAAAELALLGGAEILQYRDKSDDPVRRLREAQALAVLCSQLGKALIINDDPELAARSGAQGVHLGRDDPAIGEARRRLGAQATIGVSCYNQLERALEAQTQGADYVTFGSFFPSRSKPQAVRAGPSLLHEAKARMRIPVVAIGGLTAQNGASLVANGADALAVIEAVFRQSDIRMAAARFASLFASVPQR
jgi:thiamine-phosphate pyrophosphorylase